MRGSARPCSVRGIVSESFERKLNALRRCANLERIILLFAKIIASVALH